MIPFRTQTPASKKIQFLDYPKPEERMIGHGVKLITVPPRKNEVLKLLLHWPFGDLMQQKKYQAKGTLDLTLNGTTLLTADQIQEQFEYWGTSISPNTTMLYSDLSLKSTSEFFDDSFNWLIYNHMEAVFPEKEVETLKQIAIAGLKRKQSTPKYWAYRECARLLFGDASAMTRFTEESDIAALSTTDLKKFHADFLNPSAATLFLSGDYTEKTIDMLSMAFAGIPPAGAHSATELPFKDQVSDISEKIHPVENTSQVSMFMMRSLPVIGETEIHRFSLLNLILGGFFGSRLMQEIREEKGLTYGIGSYLMQTHHGNVWCISGEMNSVNAGLAMDGTKAIMRSLYQNPPTGDELDRAKRYYAGQLRASFDGPFAMAEKMKGLMVRGYTLKHFDTAMDSIWSCNTEDLCALADNYLHPESFKTVLAGDTK